MATTAHSGAAMHPDLEKTVSRRSRTHSNTPDDALLAGEADAELLGEHSSTNLNTLLIQYHS
jgi:hypothetical protein